jgi:hypothetical protein
LLKKLCLGEDYRFWEEVECECVSGGLTYDWLGLVTGMDGSNAKCNRILADRLRMHDFSFYDEVLEVCAELWNMKLTA